MKTLAFVFNAACLAAVQLGLPKPPAFKTVAKAKQFFAQEAFAFQLANTLEDDYGLIMSSVVAIHRAIGEAQTVEAISKIVSDLQTELIAQSRAAAQRTSDKAFEGNFVGALIATANGDT